ncbi:MAG: hypothetical protein E7379_03390 [Clostridiales bacterium]|nr:hypothetical protein [Clostridiales bacterium]
MNKTLNKAYFIVSLIGVILAFASAILVPVQILADVEIPGVVSRWVNVAVMAFLLATIIMSIFLVKGVIKKIAQIFMGIGILAILALTVLNNLKVGIGEFEQILYYVFAGALIFGAILWIFTLFVKKFKSEEKAPYFFAFEMLVFGLITLLTITGLVPNLETSFAYTFAVRILIGLVTNLYHSLELKHTDSNKPLIVFAVLLFIALSFPMAIAYSTIL